MKFLILLILLTQNSFAEVLLEETKFPRDLRGTVHVDSCSGALAQFKNEPETNRAKILTAGHCFRTEQQSIINEPANMTLEVHLDELGKKTQELKTTKILFATMKTTDVAVLELANSIAELKQMGFKIFTISDKKLSPGDDIVMLSASSHNIQQCKLTANVWLLREGPFNWPNTYKYIECVSRPGASGSPIISLNDLEIYGVNNTGNDDSQMCTNNNPCEVSEDGSTRIDPSASYAQNTFELYNCLNSHFNFDFTLSSCKFEK